MLSSHSPFFLHPLVALGTQVTVSAVTLGVWNSSASRWLSILTVPAQLGCVGIIVSRARFYVRPAYAAWVASFSVSTALRCLGQCFLPGPSQAATPPPREDSRHRKQQSHGQRLQQNDIYERPTKGSSWIKWLSTNFEILMDFRHLNSANEAKGSPKFSSRDPTYVPNRGRFLAVTALKTVLSYLLVDLLTGAPLPPDALIDFAPQRMHFFTRLGSVTPGEVAMRYVLPVSVFAVGAALMELSHAVLAFTAVSLGYNEPRDWRPQFGSPFLAFTLRRFWGQVWHQNLRITFTTWSDYVAHALLGLLRSSNKTNMALRLCIRYTKLALVFAVSGLVHLTAEVASGVPATKARPQVFFLYQALGILLEDAAEASFPSSEESKRSNAGPPRLLHRLIGYVWVLSFMAWSIPWWVFPPTHQYALRGQAPQSLVPFSVVRWKWM